MKRILFVDDETRVLDGLKRMLRRLRKEWDMHFVDSGAKALDLLAEGEPFDVVVSDMRMPGMDGTELLTAVQERYPGMIRIILSGHAELELAMRSAGCSHQFLTKPCDPDTIRSVVTRSFELHQNLASDELKAVVGKLETLPALPATYNEITAAVADEEVTLTEVAEIVERDTGLAAKVLQLVNSSYFGIPREVESLKAAVSFLGLANLQSLVLTYGMVQEFDPEGAAPSFDIEAYQQHSLQVANLARHICGDDRKLSEKAFLAGILHDIGVLVVATNRPDLYERVERLKSSGRFTRDVLERRALGVDHGDVGAYLLGIWGLADPIVEAALHHHRPAEVQPGAPLDEMAAVHLADALIREAEAGSAGSAPGPDPTLVSRMGLESYLPGWRKTANEILHGEAPASDEAA